ncbi:MAG TPA: bifunctional DNA-formamidopyrimidine glycosylase/DNA-(apurinic or apyrimidinic site) lyase [Anaerolineales bacterium]|nr:bifunctional DNA-formamidopyrimidine glycosylase/DNA-(apurinic or apyrimidinic site) lyase [Anaerolineales bacterium]HNC08396.1 bifunctional DNA-formamidopyrimidine glycosylase/DNA-(apurinic or apyrimidinic site) lyase [Anaerolineales bacterium]
MPELPEVETVARRIEPDVVGRTILSADVRWARTVATPSVKKFKEQAAGQRVLGVGRRAKYIILRLEDYNLLIHLRMSGDLTVRKGKIQPETHDRLLFTLRGKRGEESTLAFNDTRKFGRVWLTNDPESVLGKLGPEPLEKAFTPQWLYENLHKRDRQLKPLLLDQTFLAGVGNIYADESLHIAKLHPLGSSKAVTLKQAAALCEAIKSVLKEGIRRNGASIDWMYRGGEFQHQFRVYDQEGKPCPVCGTEIQKFTVGQRGTHICPKCQKLR